MTYHIVSSKDMLVDSNGKPLAYNTHKEAMEASVKYYDLSDPTLRIVNIPSGWRMVQV